MEYIYGLWCALVLSVWVVIIADILIKYVFTIE